MSDTTKLSAYLANDWKIVAETPDYWTLKKNKATAGGHILILLLLGIWTLGIANLVYHLVSRKTIQVPK